jgi:hypothetical protein
MKSVNRLLATTTPAALEHVVNLDYTPDSGRGLSTIAETVLDGDIAAREVVVDHADGLHEGIDDRRPYETESS